MTRNNFPQLLLLVFVACIMTAMFSSCSYKQSQAFLDRKNASVPITGYTGSTDVYKIKAQDVLQVRNLQNIKYIVDDVPASAGTGTPSASGGGAAGLGQSYEVAEDGSVALPVIGRVAVLGLSRLEAANKIQDLYSKNLIKNPIIEVKIINLKVTLLGEVRKPGNYPLVRDNTSLIDMLGEAGGITDKGNEKHVKIVRGGVTNPQILEIDLSDVNALSNPAIMLQNQDVVYIEQNRKSLRNEKLQNFTTLIQPALILLNSALIIFTLRK
ncbi:polysaccharide biosynthesis/export family protein [Mucilaginibacter sp. CAU 1740]|uniref:polysaccharide biosynthesis/export family protein n=1 Tax=Mucilaginibacter sp. CAU 1740 TaxID=3140365 RepID=UPI00325B790F